MLFSWIAIAKLDSNAYLSIAHNDYIKVTENPRFLKLLGFKTACAYRPWFISPRIDVWQEVERRIRRELKGHASGRSSVLRIIEANQTVENTYAFAIRFYRPNILAIEVHLKTEIEASIHDAFHLGQLEAHPAAFAAVDSLIGIISSGSTRGYKRNNSFFVRPAILAPIKVNEEEFTKWKENNKSIVANLSINNTNYAVADPTLADAIFSRNKDINVKFAGGEFSLVSKQGILTAYSSFSNDLQKHLVKEHSRRMRFLELALVIREFILEFASFRQQNEDIADFLFYLSRPLITDAPNLITTVTGAYIWKLLSDELGLKNFIESMDKHLLDEIENKTLYIQRIDQNDYHTLEFYKKVSVELRRYHRNWLEKAYERHKAVFWIVGVVIAVAGVIIRILARGTG